MESIDSDNSSNCSLHLIKSIEKYQNFKSEVNFKNGSYNLRPKTSFGINNQNTEVAKLNKGEIVNDNYGNF
jgi:hypothetical protein